MSSQKCHYCGSKIPVGSGERTVTRVSDTFKIQTFCNKGCSDSYFMRIGVDFLILGLLIVGVVVIWFLR